MNAKTHETAARRAKCDIRREADKIVMCLEMPGVEKSGLDINVDGDSLKITGRRAPVKTKGNWLVREIRPGDFSMEYSLDQTIDRKAIEAKLEKGVLTLSLGLSESVKPRKIAVLSK